MAERDTATGSALKDRQLRHARWMATGLLGLAAVIYGIATLCLSLHPSMGYVAAFSEAAMVGAMADWFAVVALFRHPMNLKFIPHTAILTANKQRIASGIAEFIQRNFLSSQAIVDRIAAAGPAGKLRDWFLLRHNVEKLAELTVRILAWGLSAFDDARVRQFLIASTTSKLQQFDVASAASRILDVLTENKRHHVVLDEVLRLVEKALENQETRERIAKAVAAESPLIDVVKKMGWNLDETIALKIVNSAARIVEDVRSDPGHSLRIGFDAFIAEYIEKLKRDDGTREKIHNIRDELIGNPAFAGFIGELWKEFRAWLADDLADRESRVRAAIVVMVNSLSQTLDADPTIQRWVDEQILNAVPALVEENRARIGKFIEERINEWHEEAFVAELERELGRDLQFIRINGTLVGGLVGLLIYTASQVLR